MRPDVAGPPSTATGIEVGGLAPDFTLRDQFGQEVRLSDFRGRKAVVLMFFPFAFTGVCTGELSGVRDRLDEFLSFDTEVLAISCDSVYALRTFAESEGLNFPLLSDWWPHGAVSQAYEAPRRWSKGRYWRRPMAFRPERWCAACEPPISAQGRCWRAISAPATSPISRARTWR